MTLIPTFLTKPRIMMAVDLIGFAIVVILILVFLVGLNRWATNAPFALDDAKMYLGSFMEKFLDVDSAREKVAYFFSVTNFPHAKMSGRFVSTVHYWITGQVDFKFLIMFGAGVLCAFVLAARAVFFSSFLFVVPLAVILLSAGRIHYWVGPITGYPFLLLYAGAIYWMFARGYHMPAITLAVVTSFTHSPGLMIFIPAILVLFLTRPLPIRELLLWSAAFVGTFYLYNVLILQGNSVSRGDGAEGIPGLSELFSIFIFTVKLINLPFRTNLLNDNSLWVDLVIGGLFAIPLTAFIIGAIKSAYLNRPDFRTALAFYLFCMAPVGIAALTMDDGSILKDEPAPRYIMYAYMAWVGTYILAGTQLRSFGAKAALAIILSFVFAYPYEKELRQVPRLADYMAYRWLDIAGSLYSDGDDPSQGENRRDAALEKIVNEARERGIYSPKFTNNNVLSKPGIPVSQWKQSAENISKLVWITSNVKDRVLTIELIASSEKLKEMYVLLSQGDIVTAYSLNEVPANRVINRNRDAKSLIRKVRPAPVRGAIFGRYIERNLPFEAAIVVDGIAYRL